MSGFLPDLTNWGLRGGNGDGGDSSDVSNHLQQEPEDNVSTGDFTRPASSMKAAKQQQSSSSVSSEENNKPKAKTLIKDSDDDYDEEEDSKPAAKPSVLSKPGKPKSAKSLCASSTAKSPPVASAASATLKDPPKKRKVKDHSGATIALEPTTITVSYVDNKKLQKKKEMLLKKVLSVCLVGGTITKDGGKSSDHHYHHHPFPTSSSSHADSSCVMIDVGDNISITKHSISDVLSIRLSLPLDSPELRRTSPPQKPLIPYLAQCYRRSVEEIRSMKQSINSSFSSGGSSSSKLCSTSLTSINNITSGHGSSKKDSSSYSYSASSSSSTSSSLSKIQQKNEILDILYEIKRQVVNYAASCLMLPELFEQGMDSRSQLASCLLNSVSDHTNSITTLTTSGSSMNTNANNNNKRNSFYYQLCEELLLNSTTAGGDRMIFQTIVSDIVTIFLKKLSKFESILDSPGSDTTTTTTTTTTTGSGAPSSSSSASAALAAAISGSSSGIGGGSSGIGGSGGSSTAPGGSSSSSSNNAMDGTGVIGNSSPLIIISAFTSFCIHRKVAEIVTSLPNFLLPAPESSEAKETVRPSQAMFPSGGAGGADLLRMLAGENRPYLKRSGPALDKDTILGLMLRLGIPRNNSSFSPTSILRQSLDTVDRINTQQRQQLRIHQDSCNSFILSLIKAGENPRTNVMRWFVDALLVNVGASALRPDPSKVSSSTTLLNATVCLLKLCEPFINDESKLHLIDPGFVSSPKDHLGVYITTGDDAVPRLGSFTSTSAINNNDNNADSTNTNNSSNISDNSNDANHDDDPNSIDSSTNEETSGSNVASSAAAAVPPSSSFNDASYDNETTPPGTSDDENNNNNNNNDGDDNNNNIDSNMITYNPKNKFIPQVFFFTARFLHLGIVPLLSYHENLLRHINHTHWELTSQNRDISSDPHFSILVSKQRINEVALFQEELIVDTLRFCNLMGRVLYEMDENDDENNDDDEYNGALSHDNCKYLRSMPEHFVDNICDIVISIAKMRPRLLRDLEFRYIFKLIVKLLSSKYASMVRNYNLRAMLGDVLYELYLPSGSSGSGDDRNRDVPTSVSTDRLAGGQTYLLSDSTAQESLAPSLLLLYGEVEHTGYYDKMSHRAKIASLIKYLWESSEHRPAFRRITQNRESFVKFANGIMNETNTLIATIMQKLPEIREIQVKMKNTSEFNRLSEEERNIISSRLDDNEREVKHALPLFNKTLQMFGYLNTDRDIRSLFLLEELCPRLVTMLLHVLTKLVGTKGLNLKVDHPEQYDFRPKEMLRDLSAIFSLFTSSKEFQMECARCNSSTTNTTGKSHDIEDDDALYNSLQITILLRKAIKTCKRLNLLIGESMIIFESLPNLVEQEYKNVLQDELLLQDAPDEFKDEILDTFMKDPIILPSGHYVDRSTITQHLLNDPIDPFNRIPMSIDDVKPATELKERMMAWLDSKRGEQKPSSKSVAEEKISFSGSGTSSEAKAKTDTVAVAAAIVAADTTNSAVAAASTRNSSGTTSSDNSNVISITSPSSSQNNIGTNVASISESLSLVSEESASYGDDTTESSRKLN